MRLIIIFIMAFFLSCQSQHTDKKKSDIKAPQEGESIQKQMENPISAIETTKPTLSFLDSVLYKYELSSEQIRVHTMIDSFYYTGSRSDVIFTGDTVFGLHDKLKGLIIDYDDRENCIYKFLFIFNTIDTQNTDYRKIYSNCDRDKSSDYYRLDYKFLSDSSFQTSESFIPRNSDKITKIERIKMRVNNRGRIDTMGFGGNAPNSW